MFKHEYLQSGSFVDCNTVIGSETVIGVFSIIRGGCTVGKNVRIGNYVHIGENVIIGDDCIISDYAYIGNNADGFFTDTRFDKKAGFGTVILHPHVTVMSYVKIEPPLNPLKQTEIGTCTHIGHASYIKENAFVGAHTNIGAYCLIGEHSVIDGNCILSNRTTVGAYTHLKEGCNAANACLFENNKTYSKGWHGSLRPALTARAYVRQYRMPKTKGGTADA